MLSILKTNSMSPTARLSSLACAVISSPIVNKISGMVPKIINAAAPFLPSFKRNRLIDNEVVYAIPSWFYELYKNRIIPFVITQNILSLGVRWCLNLPLAGSPFSTTLKVIFAGFLYRGSLALAGLKMVRSLPQPWGYFTSLYFGEAKWVDQLIKGGFDVNVACPRYGEWTPLHFASAADFKSDHKSLELLLKAGANVHTRDFEGNTPLHLARDDQTVELLLAYGADINSLNFKGQTPFHTASMHTNLPGINLMLAAGANAEARDLEGNTPLYLVCKTKDSHPQLKIKAAKALLDKGADPFVRIPNTNFSPLTYSINNIELVGLLTKTENVPLFNSCTKLHQLCDLLFPPVKQNLPLNWKRIVSRIPKSSNLLALEREFLRQQNHSLKEPLSTILVEENSSIETQCPLTESQLNALKSKPIAFLEAHPNRLMKLAWRLLNQTDKIVIKEVADKDFVQFGVTSFAYGRGACYFEKSHEIWVNKNSPHKISSIIFECMNALQRDSFNKLDHLSSLGEISREELPILNEWIEYHSSLWHEQIISEMGLTEETLDLQINASFQTLWKFVNIPLLPWLSSHAEVYRRAWDSLYSSAYFAKHPRFIEDRIAMMSKEITPYCGPVWSENFAP